MTNSHIQKLMNEKFFSLTVFMIAWSLTITGQEYRKMTPEVYNVWKKIKNPRLSDSAETVIYTLEREQGDKELAVYNKAKESTTIFSRVNKSALDDGGTYVVFTQGLAYDSVRTLKRKKTAKDKMPKDSLVIYNTGSGELQKIPGVENFTLPEKQNGLLFYTRKLEKPKSDTLKQEGKKKKPVCDEASLIIRHLASGKEDTILAVKDYTIAEDTAVVLFSQCTGDSLARYSAYIRTVITSDSFSQETIYEGLSQIAQLSLNKTGSRAAFLGLAEKSEAKQKPYELFLKTESDIEAIKLAGSRQVIRPEGWVISSDRKPTFSESGNRLFYGIAPLLPIADTMLLDDEKVMVEIWHHDSPRLYTQMEATLDRDKKKSYDVLYDIIRDTVVQLESPYAERSTVSLKGDGRFTLQLRSTPYEKEVTWTGDTRKDIILLDNQDGSSIQIAAGETGNPVFSPAGKYVYWWAKKDSIWRIYDIQKKSLGYLGLWSTSRFHDEENDMPMLAEAYGMAGWLKDDESALVYDRYDIWKLNPTDVFSAVVLTDGRANREVHRYVDLDSENEEIDPAQPMLLHRFNERTKSEAYLWLEMVKGTSVTAISGDVALTKSVQKARKKDAYLFTKQNFEIFPDLLLTDSGFQNDRRISDANPQQKDYGWGSASLFQWTNYRGNKNEGMIFYPPNFDASRKYPLIVNFYERSSDDLHRHRAPEAHRSSINYSYYTNLGYVVFNPDIKYTTGKPGEDCFNAVESGVDALTKQGFIDETRMALQGHSWGGYQIAYLLTKTDRYRCAEAGAPVVNMVSAYGGIRWESGMSRMFQYEKTQSRLGATLWENTLLFHKNSPIYEMPKVSTPVLIMHNDEDGAVPWYQGIEYYMSLRRLGKPAWLLNYNGEPHWPVKWQNRLDFNIRMEQFFNHYLMDKPIPKWMEEGNTPIEKGIINKY